MKKIGVNLTRAEISDVISCQNLAIEHVLEKVYNALQKTTGKNLLNRNDVDEEIINGLRKELKEKLDNKVQLIRNIETLEIKYKRQERLYEELRQKLTELQLKLQKQ